MKAERKGWKWAFCLLGVGAALQLYFVQELIAVLAFFAIGFAALAVVIGTLYMFHKGWAAVVARLTNSEDSSGPGLQAGRPAREMP